MQNKNVNAFWFICSIYLHSSDYLWCVALIVGGQLCGAQKGILTMKMSPSVNEPRRAPAIPISEEQPCRRWIFFPWGCQTKQDFGSEGDQRGSPDLVPVMPMCVFFLGDYEWTKIRMDGRKEGT